MDGLRTGAGPTEQAVVTLAQTIKGGTAPFDLHRAVEGALSTGWADPSPAALVAAAVLLLVMSTVVASAYHHRR